MFTEFISKANKEKITILITCGTLVHPEQNLAFKLCQISNTRCFVSVEGQPIPGTGKPQ